MTQIEGSNILLDLAGFTVTQPIVKKGRRFFPMVIIPSE